MASNKEIREYFENIEKKLEKSLKKGRFRHTLGVAYTSVGLAMRYGEDIVKAQTAGLLHDVAKGMDEKALLKAAKDYGIRLSDFEKENPFIIHGPVGAYVAKKEFGIDDQDIFNAIYNHTTGREDMSLLEKIVFVADYIEPMRCEAENLEEIRKMAFENIDSCVLKILEDTLAYLEKSGNPIDEKTNRCAKWYRMNS